MTHIIGYGSPEQPLVDLAFANFAGASIAGPSFCTTPVELLSLDGEDQLIAHATGFYWRHAGLDFVVTNWHVVSGRNPFTGQLMDQEHAFIPRRIRVYRWRIEYLEGQIRLLRPGFTYDLADVPDLYAEPILVNGRAVDIAALPLAEPAIEGPAGPRAVDIQPCVNMRVQDRIETQAGDECVILGYPLAQYSGLFLPIWKRGSLATDTNMPVDGAPAFLIDAATSQAMSGSPIFRRITGMTHQNPTTQIVAEHRGYQFLGVYAGRLQSRELAQINVGYGRFANQVDAAVAESWARWSRVLEARVAGVTTAS